MNNKYINKYINDIKNENVNVAKEKLPRLYFENAGSAKNEFQEIPKTYHDINDSNNDNVTTYVLFNNISYSGLCEKNNEYFDFDYINDDPNILEPYILKYNGDDFVNILESKHNYAINLLNDVKQNPILETTVGPNKEVYKEKTPYQRIYGTRGEPDAISNFVLDDYYIVFINKFDRTTLEYAPDMAENLLSRYYTKNSQSYLVEKIYLRDDGKGYLRTEYYWPSEGDEKMKNIMLGLHEYLPTTFNNDTRLCYPSKETNEYVLQGTSDSQNQIFNKYKISFNKSRWNFVFDRNTFTIPNGEPGYFDHDVNCYRTLIAYPFIQKSIKVNTKKYLIDLTKAITNQNVPIDTNLKVIGNIIYKNHKISVNGLRIVSEDGNSDNLKELVFNIDDEFRTNDNDLLSELKNGTLTITSDNYFKKCDLNIFYFKE